MAYRERKNDKNSYLFKNKPLRRERMIHLISDSSIKE
jgi:hypothetical protein